MKKIITTAALVAAGIAMATLAHADNDSTFGGGLAAGAWSFTAAAGCLVDAVVDPVLGDVTGDLSNACVNGKVINHSRSTPPGPAWSVTPSVAPGARLGPAGEVRRSLVRGRGSTPRALTYTSRQAAADDGATISTRKAWPASTARNRR